MRFALESKRKKLSKCNIDLRAIRNRTHYGIKLICRAGLNIGALWYCDIMQKFLSGKVGRIALLLPIKRRTSFTSLKVVIDNPHGETGDKMLIF